MNINKLLLVSLFAVTSIFSNVKYDNAKECAEQELIKGGLGFVFSVLTVKANDKWKTETPLEKAQLKNEETKGLLEEAQMQYQKSQTFAQKFDTHLKNCGNHALHFDTKINQYKDTPCGRNWEKWAALLEKDTQELYAEYNDITDKKQVE